jgi:hypothetical protein
VPRLTGTLTSITSLLRNLPLFFSSSPRTPLRVLCIVALDTIHVRRYSRPLPRHRRRELAWLVDFQACTNAEWDGKPLSVAEHQTLRRRLEEAGLGSWAKEYCDRLCVLETLRPCPGGDRRRFDQVRSYREAVARLSLATIASIALHAESLDEGLNATESDANVAALFRLAMQCQIIDDVVDYRQDLAAGLPSFLTACESLPEAMTLTAGSARSYGKSHGRSMPIFPLHAALTVITAMTRLVVRIGMYQTPRTATQGMSGNKITQSGNP